MHENFPKNNVLSEIEEHRTEKYIYLYFVGLDFVNSPTSHGELLYVDFRWCFLRDFC